MIDSKVQKKLVLPSDQKFGLFFAFLGVICFFYFQLNEKFFISYFFLFLSTILILISLTNPKLLNSFNLLWMKVGLFMGKIMSPIILGSIFFILITPISIITKIFKRDELKLKKNKSNSCWIKVVKKLKDQNLTKQF